MTAAQPLRHPCNGCPDVGHDPVTGALCTGGCQRYREFEPKWLEANMPETLRTRERRGNHKEVAEQ